MPFDALTLHAVRDELDRSLLGGRIDRVVWSGEAEFALEVYLRPNRTVLLVSTEAQHARVCLVEGSPQRLDAPDSPFLLLMRKHVRGAIIRTIEQPYLERVLRLGLAGGDRDTAPEVTLIIETMGRRSNATLVDAQGIILDASKRVPPSRNPGRPILPHLPYLEPPPQIGMLEPSGDRFGVLMLERALAAARANLAQFLSSNVRGISPQAAREAAFRAFGSTSHWPETDAEWSRLGDAVRGLADLVRTRQWEPCVAIQDGSVLAYAPYRITHLQDASVETTSTVSEAVERGMHSASGEAGPRAAATTRPFLIAIEQRRLSVARRRDTLRRALADRSDPNLLLAAGNALLASLGSLAPGQTSFEFDGATYALDPDVPPLEQAKHLFRDYRKARDAGRTLPKLFATAELEIAHLAELAAMVGLAIGPDVVRALRTELAMDGLLGPIELKKAQRRAAKYPAATPRHWRTEADKFEILVGTSARSNDFITFRLARSDDIWLHARGVPGAHVVLRTAGETPPDVVLLRAASLAAGSSVSRTADRVEVDWTAKRYVRKVAGGPPGLVTYTNQQSVFVPPARDAFV